MDRSAGSTTMNLDGEHTMETTSSKPQGRKASRRGMVALFDTAKKEEARYALAAGVDFAEELPIVSALRELRRCEARPLMVRTELLEHGYVSIAKAAELLGKSKAEIKRRSTAAPGAYVPEGRLPLITPGIPISELLRSVISEWQKEKEALAHEVVKLVTIDGQPVQWRRWPTHLEGLAERMTYIDVPRAAAELGLSKAEVERQLRDDGPDSLFAIRVAHRRWCFSPEEIAAYKRKLQRAKAGEAA